MLSLTALNALESKKTLVESQYRDALGHAIDIGDQVLFLHPMEQYAEIGTIKSMAAKSCLLDIELNRFGKTEYRKKYEEIISLTAIGKENLKIEKD